MQIDFDWAQIYAALISQSSRRQKSAFAAARQIENDIYREGWPAGEVFGDQSDLIHRYGISRAILREAVRLLEDRHIARMRRGPGGGLVVLTICGGTIARTVADYFRMTGVTAAQLQQARIALEIIAAYRQSLAAGPAALDAFTREFRGHLAAGPGTGLSAAGAGAHRCAVSAGGHAVSDLFGACLSSIEDQVLAKAGAMDREVRSLEDGRHSYHLLNQGRAHELARKLALELPRSGGGAQRVSTEDQLCERHHVGREVLRQAIRVLESRGLIDCQRGRTHGLHAGASDAAALVELVVAYFCSIRLTWEEFFPIACILSRIVRMVLAAESTRAQRQALLRRLECAPDWADAPSLITTQLHSEWACVSNPILIFMERCVTAYCARASTGVWKSFDDSGLYTLRQQLAYTEAIARGDLVRADSLVEKICAQVCISRNMHTFDVAGAGRRLA
jgi:DNA-binding FadR family transcriptional regulator